jgi:hypothetical protein
MKADEGVAKKKEIACAKDLLDNAARVRNVTEGAALAANIHQRKSSNIASDVTYDELWSRAASVLGTGQWLSRVGVCLLIEWRSSQDVGDTKGSRLFLG